MIVSYFDMVAFIGHNGYCFLAENKRHGKARRGGGRSGDEGGRAERDDSRIKRIVFAVRYGVVVMMGGDAEMAELVVLMPSPKNTG